MKSRVVVYLVLLIVVADALGQGTAGTRGLRLKCENASPGYLLFAPMTSNTTYLVNLDGKAVRTWQSAYLPSAWVYLLNNGHVLRGGSDHGNSPFGGGGQGGRFQEFDLEGNLVWDFQYNQPRLPHHDVAVLPNGNILAIAWEGKSAQETRQAGRRQTAIPSNGIWPDMLIEFEPQRPNGARIVWEWHIWDHLIQNLDPSLDNYGDPAAHPEKININADTGGAGFSRDVFHTNAVDYNPELDQIIVSVPTFNEVWVVDHSTTTQEAAARTGGHSGKGGDLLYRWGNPQTYGRGTAADQLLGFQHDARWVPRDLPGGGHIMVFSNRTPSPDGGITKVYEFIPPVDAEGHYAIPDTGPFGPAQPLWTYSNDSLDTTNLSGAERQPNSNTLISSGPDGRLFEVTAAGNIVWDYWSPYTGSPLNNGGAFSLFRATRIPQDHPGLKGHDLSPLNPQPPIPSFASIATGPTDGGCPAVPTLTDIQPSTLGQGGSVDVTLTGTNFSPGLTLTGDNIIVSGVQVINATTATATLTIAFAAPLGPANLKVVTSAGTSAPATLTVVEPFPDLLVRSSHTGNFGAGFKEKYFVTISNTGAMSATGPIIVRDVLPPGFSFVSGEGADWSCSGSGQEVTCTLATSLAPSDSAGCTLTVEVSRQASARVSHSVTVVAGGDLNQSNNATTEAITVVSPIPAFVFTPYPLIPGRQATVALTMATPFPHDVKGSIHLGFDSNALVPVDDPAIQFATGGRIVDFTIPASDTEARFGPESIRGPLAFQPGTVAGTLKFSGELTAGTVQENFAAENPGGLTIPLRALSIQKIQTSTQDGFTISLLLFSAAREVTQLSLLFNTTPKVQLSCGSTTGCSAAGNALTLDVAPLFVQWFKGDSTFGGLAQVRLPFRIDGGVVKGTVAVTLKNTQGESNSESFVLP